ncbi:MAG: carbohydrate-binding domain-containing protein [Clostridia bacterium]
MKKKIISTGLILALLISGSGCVFADKTYGIKVIYDGEVINFDVEPEIINDRTMVPMRAIFEAFGAKVKWDGETSTVTAKRKSKTISMTIGSTEMTKNEESYSFDTAPMIEEGRTLVPVRAISDLLELDVDWDEDTKTVTITTPTDLDSDEWKSNTGTIDLTNMTVSGNGVSVSDNAIEISQGGDFDVSGTLADGMIHVNTGDKVKLRLSGASITNPTGPAIYFENADKCYITLTEDTENYLSDGEAYSDEAIKGCLTAKSNLEIKGGGSLIIDGKYKRGIQASDSMEIANGNITINAADDGIHVNETLEISGGNINVTAVSDGIQAEEIIDITGGTVDVTTTGEVAASTNDMFGRNDFGGNMPRPEEMTDEERRQMREQMNELMQKRQEAIQQEEAADESEDGSSKGIKAGWLMDISGGEINVVSTDHAVHCQSDINIFGGKLNLSSSVKKGISSHENIDISDGDINITNATEGIESKKILTVTGGNIDIICSDDGFNAGGNGMGAGFGRGGGMMMPPDDAMMPENGVTPPDKEMMDIPSFDMQNTQDSTMPEMPKGRPGMNGADRTEVSTEHHIQIDGGNIYINAGGDGIDSNGSLVINGGRILVEGPETGGDSALDTDGLMQINGGEVIAAGAVGMVEMPSDTSEQAVMVYTFSELQAPGKTFSIKNSDGNVIAEYKSKKSFENIIYSTEYLNEGETYTIYSDNDKIEDIVLSSRVTSVGSPMHGGGRGNFSDRGEKGNRGMDASIQDEAAAQ